MSIQWKIWKYNNNNLICLICMKLGQETITFVVDAASQVLHPSTGESSISMPVLLEFSSPSAYSSSVQLGTLHLLCLFYSSFVSSLWLSFSSWLPVLTRESFQKGLSWSTIGFGLKNIWRRPLEMIRNFAKVAIFTDQIGPVTVHPVRTVYRYSTIIVE